MRTLLITSERFGEHGPPPGHPERIERAEVMDGIAIRWREKRGRTAEPRPATRDELLRVHAPAYVDNIAGTAGRATMLDPDTFTSPESYEIALLAAGAAVSAVDHALAHDAPAVAFVRPPGHHAERDRAMGFCLFNNIAVAAAHARRAGCGRVAIVDYDVHHGNGTQWIFYEDPSVLYVSTHQYPYYPGTGAADEIGRGAGTGFTVNLPLEAGSTDADYDLAFRTVVTPVVDAFAPDLLLVSAGYDAHENDPLGGMRVTTGGYTQLTRRLRASADHVCKGRIVLITEGGYDLAALGACLDASLGAFEEPASPSLAVIDGSTERGQDAIRAARSALGSRWPIMKG